MNRERIATLIARGLPAGQVASIVGLTPSRVSQLQKEEDFLNLVESKRAEGIKEAEEEQLLSDKYTAAEHQLLNQVLQLAPMSEMRDVIGALKVVAERQDRVKNRQAGLLPPGQQPHQILNVVSVTLPSHALAAPLVTLNSSKEVVAIDNKPLAPLPAEAVVSLFNTMKGDSHEQVSGNPGPEGRPTEVLPSQKVIEASTTPGSTIAMPESFLAFAHGK